VCSAPTLRSSNTSGSWIMAQGKIIKMLRSVSAAILLIGFLNFSASAATPEGPKPAASAAASASAAVAEQVTPEEAKRRKDWSQSMQKKPAP